MSELAQNLIEKERKEKSGNIDLGNCGLTAFPQALFELHWLEELSMSNIIWNTKKKTWTKSLNHGPKNRLRGGLPAEFKNLKNLKKLRLAGINPDYDTTRIGDYSILESLEKLQILDLSYNQINDIGFLKNLTCLHTLYLAHNQISDYDVLYGVPLLNRFSFSSKKINRLTFLEDLINLEDLDLSYNSIKNFHFLEKLQNLKSLKLIGNQIHDIKFLEKLKQIRKLSLSSNQIIKIDSLEKLKKLEYLELNNNKIQDIRPLENLKNLTLLDLSKNAVSDLRVLEKLPHIKSLEINENDIKDISPILPLIKNKVHLNWSHNPFGKPPQEIVEQGDESIVRYFEELKISGPVTLYEAKVLLVGEGNVGKTTLLIKLEDRNAEIAKNGKRTSGIDVLPLTFEMKNGETFRLNFWDFGGQEIYYATHKFFLTHRSLYVLLTQTRQKNDNFDYWIPTIELFGGRSPILIVKNLWEGINSPLSINRFRINDRFNLPEDIFEVNLIEGKGVDRIEKAILYHVENLPQFGDSIPTSWLQLRSEIQTLAKETEIISYKQFFDLCIKNQINDQELVSDLGNYFHDLGIFLWYREINGLKNKIILQPQWATNAVYQIIDDQIVQKNNGTFGVEDIKRIWKSSSYQDLHEELLNLMMAFKICYKKKNKKEFIVPSMLPADPVPYSWDNKTNLQIEYQYDFLPKGIVNQLTAEQHLYIKGENLVWSRGVILAYENSEAEVIEDWYNRKIIIRTCGFNSRGLMQILMKEIDEINMFYRGAQFTKIVNCICNHCSQSDQAEKFEYKKLINILEKGRSTYYCNEGGEAVDILHMLFTIGVDIEKNFYPNRKTTKKRVNDSIEKKSDKPLRVFISCPKNKKHYLEKLRTHIRILERKNLIAPWDDEQIFPGDKWDEKVHSNLENAAIIIFLVTAETFYSDYIWSVELRRAIERHKDGTIALLPIILEDCLWEESPFAKIRILPENSKPVNKWEHESDAWTNIANRIKAVAEKLRNNI